MKASAVIRNLRNAAIIGLFSVVSAGSASATIITNTFDFTNDLSQRFISATGGNRWYVGSGTATTTYDTDTDALNLAILSTGGIYGTNPDDSANLGNVIAGGVTGNFNVNFTNVTLTNNPYTNSLIATSAAGSVSSGTATISNLGNGTGATYNVEAGAMDFNDPQFALAIAGTQLYAEMAALNAANGGAASFFQFLSPSLGELNYNTWLHSTGPVTAGGLSFASVAGDLHGRDNSVPEPATLGLLSLGLFGGAIKRRRAKSA